MTYATIKDVQDRMPRTLTTAERNMLQPLLADAGALIDALAPSAATSIKVIVSCRMAMRVLGDGQNIGVPVGASQGSMSALGYSQSWTIGSGGAAGELYISKTERRMLGVGNAIGSRSPVEDIAARPGGPCHD